MRGEFQRTCKQPGAPWHAVLRSFNGYGLFRTMTLSRPEFVLEGSGDDVNWHEYEFPYKAGDIYSRGSTGRYGSPHFHRSTAPASSNG